VLPRPGHRSLNRAEHSRIVAVGHSWGSTLGIFMVKARPDLSHAFVGTGQVADPARNYAVAYDELLKKAKSLGDERAIRELEQVGSDRRRSFRRVHAIECIPARTGHASASARRALRN
jgi:pimeloyl-ACP methyl ester carboxylesterase